MAASEEEISSIHDVGGVAGASLRNWLDEPHNRKVLEKLQAAGVTPQEAEVFDTSESPIAGKVFVFTGTLTMERRDAEALVKRYGARASGSVSKKTDYVVAGDNAGSKADRARELGVTVLTEEEFRELLPG